MIDNARRFMLGLSINLASPVMFWAAMVVLVAMVAIARVRRLAISRVSMVLALLSGMAVSLAVGELTWQRPATTDVVVMVDLSASTRGAGYRDRQRLEARIKQLVDPAVRYEILYFAASNTSTPPWSADGKFADLAGDRTIFAPLAAPAILLFSDARFALPGFSPPVFVVADPELDRPDDAAVVALRAQVDRGMSEQLLTATVRVLSRPATMATAKVTGRRLTITPAATQPTIDVEPGLDPITLSRPLRPGATLATAAFEAGITGSSRDLWPENDALALPLIAPGRSERWFVSTAAVAPGAEWKLIAPAALPALGSPDYLAASLIVLDNLSAAVIPVDRQRALEQYVRDLGGALVIAGGDRAFAAGLYSGTPLEAISPLASSPPLPTTHWILLADSSGSMSQPIAAGASETRWQRASRALLDLVPTLPPDDPVSLGSFSSEVTWWMNPSRKAARDVAAVVASLPPRSIAPGGPTNLAAALERIATETDATTPTELLVLSDADVLIEDPAALAGRLKGKKIRLHLLAIADPGVNQPKGLGALRTITRSTGGTLVSESGNPAQWAVQVRQLLSATFPNRLSVEPTRARFLADLATLSERAVAPWNRTWLKASATLLAQTTAAEAPASVIPLAARQAVGAGEVVATGFAPNAAELEMIARRSARPPRDPRFRIVWTPGSRVGVRIDIKQRGGGDSIEANNLRFTVAVAARDLDAGAPLENQVIPQTAPGRYELFIDAPRTPAFATLRLENQVIDQMALAGRYAPEFDEIGNDYAAMERLARETGGEVITAVRTKRLDLPTPRQALLLTPYLALVGAGLLGLALVWWRWS